MIRVYVVLYMRSTNFAVTKFQYKGQSLEKAAQNVHYNIFMSKFTGTRIHHSLIGKIKIFNNYMFSLKCSDKKKYSVKKSV